MKSENYFSRKIPRSSAPGLPPEKKLEKPMVSRIQNSIVTRIRAAQVPSRANEKVYSNRVGFFRVAGFFHLAFYKPNETFNPFEATVSRLGVAFLDSHYRDYSFMEFGPDFTAASSKNSLRKERRFKMFHKSLSGVLPILFRLI